MSTRCQVVVKQEGLDAWIDERWLYHHTDGYPEYMIPLIAEGYNIAVNYLKDKHGWEHCSYMAGRAGKAASFLCYVDPGIFEPEPKGFHSDIEYYYEIYLVNTQSGSIGEIPSWDIKVYTTDEGFWSIPSKGKMSVLYERQPLDDLLKALGEESELAPQA